ncbi:class I SAM-dependent methyltransferase [Bacillus alkalicellulosilyticus]|uniref:class I SAM-dependent methyltransferase n=1 Tax=Alkalihalobacterium alkalicellulosilyticum TaxID=1912214 RepID=UPI0009979275|nr:class I SAM-dependent methyltransferase [Bacillus alkalicellulosilyticus]
MESVISFYENYDEESRLSTDNSRKIEFMTTIKNLDHKILPTHRVLELGAGTGIYSFYYANRGCNVVATDITPKYVQYMNQKNNLLNFRAEIANATNLTNFETESFDVVLCLGPMYHLTEEMDRVKCIKESVRVLKDGGLLAISYINKHYILHSLMMNDSTYLKKEFIEQIINTGTIKEGDKYNFWTDAFFSTPEEMERIIKDFNVEIIDHFATDGLSPYLRSTVNSFSEEEYRNWSYYIERSCRDKNIMGLSNHALLLCRKT